MPGQTDKSKQSNPGSLELVMALNAIATTLQHSIGSEDNVYSIFQEQVIALGMRGGISLLDETGKYLDFMTVAFTNPLRKILSRFEKKLDTRAVGYRVPVMNVDAYRTVVDEGRSVFVEDTSSVAAQVVPQQIQGVISPLLNILGRPPGIFAPLVYEGRIKGMLNMVSPHLTEADIPTMQAFANQIAVALENSRLVSKLQKANLELEIAYQKTLEGWVQALDLRDNVTEGHTLRTAEFTTLLARQMGIPEQDIPHVHRGALLHDIGKMSIPDSILKKPGPLSEDEWIVMRQHPSTAHAWLSTIDYLKPASVIPFCHHEKWNGTGYPRGLKGELIPLWARIFAVVDVWDAMGSDRPYRKAIPSQEIFQFIRTESGRMFDPHVVKAFFEILPN